MGLATSDLPSGAVQDAQQLAAIAPIGMIYYNKRMFDEASIPYPDGSWTWDFKERPELREKDFIWVMHQLTKRNAEGKTVRWGYVSAWPSLAADTFALSQGARYADNVEDPTKLYFNDPRIIRAFQYVADLSLKDHVIPSNTELNSQLQSTASQLLW